GDDGGAALLVRLEVSVKVPLVHPRLLGDVADAARVVALAREDAHRGVEELSPFVLSLCALRQTRGRFLRLLAVRRLWRRLRELADRPGHPAHRLLQVARDDPDLVRLALRDLRRDLQVLVRERLGSRLALP